MPMGPRALWLLVVRRTHARAVLLESWVIGAEVPVAIGDDATFGARWAVLADRLGG